MSQLDLTMGRTSHTLQKQKRLIRVRKRSENTTTGIRHGHTIHLAQDFCFYDVLSKELKPLMDITVMNVVPWANIHSRKQKSS